MAEKRILRSNTKKHYNEQEAARRVFAGRTGFPPMQSLDNISLQPGELSPEGTDTEALFSGTSTPRVHQSYREDPYIFSLVGTMAETGGQAELWTKLLKLVTSLEKRTPTADNLSDIRSECKGCSDMLEKIRSEPTDPGISTADLNDAGERIQCMKRRLDDFNSQNDLNESILRELKDMRKDANNQASAILKLVETLSKTATETAQPFVQVPIVQTQIPATIPRVDFSVGNKVVPNTIDQEEADEPEVQEDGEGVGVRQASSGQQPPGNISLRGLNSSVASSSGEGLVVYSKKITDKLMQCVESLDDMCSVMPSTLTAESDVLAADERKADIDFNYKQLQKYEDIYDRDCLPSDDLDKICMEMHRLVKLWKSELTERKIHFHMHLKPEHGKIPEIHIPKFTGKPDDVIVYEFLEMFDRFTSNSFSPLQQADLIYNQYLNDDIKREVESFKKDIRKISIHLKKKYGDLRKIVDVKADYIKSLEHPGRNKEAGITYFKKVYQILLQLDALGNNSLVSSDEIRGVLYSVSFVDGLVRGLPQDVQSQYHTECFKYEEKHDYEENISSVLTGKKCFAFLLKVAKGKWSILEKNLGTEKLQVKPKVHFSDNQDHDAPGGSYPDNDLESIVHSLALKAFDEIASQGKKRGKNDKTASVCTSSPPSFLKCPIQNHSHACGLCAEFLGMTTAEKFKSLKEAKRCFSCFRDDCYSKGPGCDYLNVLPVLMLCQDCGVNNPRRMLNILLCRDSKHAKPRGNDLQKALCTFFGKYDRSLIDQLKSSIQVNVLKMPGKVCHHQKKTVNCSACFGKESASGSSPVDRFQKIPCYDPMTGSPVTCEDIRVVKDADHDSVYILQEIEMNKSDALLFYDTGASGNCVRGAFAERHEFKVLDSRSVPVGTIGAGSIYTGFGTYSCRLMNKYGQPRELVLQGFNQVTGTIPRYSWKKIIQNMDGWENIPLPKYVGGKAVDILIGIKSSDLTPIPVSYLPCGLTVFETQFVDKFGSCYAFGGCAEVITDINRRFGSARFNTLRVYLKELSSAYLGLPTCLGPQWICESQEVEGKGLSQLGRPAVKILALQDPLTGRLDTGVTGLSEKDVDDILMESSKETMLQVCSCSTHKAKIPIQKLRELSDPDDYDGIVDFRCTLCRKCEECKRSPRVRAISLKELKEQELIDKSITFDLEQKKTFIDLPFTRDPVEYFKERFPFSGKFGKHSNYLQANKILSQQCKKPIQVKEGMIAVVHELLELGFVRKLTDMKAEFKQAVEDSPVLHFMPWRAVYKENSISTPVRLVVDASCDGLNIILCKGENTMNRLSTILIASRFKPVLWTTDVSKLFNQLKLNPSAVPYSLFLFEENMDASKEPEVWGMEAGWYGVESTLNQAQTAMRKLAQLRQAEMPLGAAAIIKSAYVDDVSDGAATQHEAEQMVKEVREILAAGGMSLKFVAFSGQDPCSKASKDGINTSLLGYNWKPKQDVFSLGFGTINFNKKTRSGRKENPFPVETSDDVEKLLKTVGALTRRIVVGKIGELFDPLGLLEPLKSMFKIQLSAFNGLGWDDPIPLECVPVWENNFKMFVDIPKVMFKRCVIPVDAAEPLQIRLLGLSDAAEKAGGSAIYCSVLRRDASWSVQLVCAKSKCMRNSIPRNELSACSLGAELMFSVYSAMNGLVEDFYLFVDSTVALCWIINQSKQLLTFCRHRVQNIHRFCSWMEKEVPPVFHIEGPENVSDLLTKGGVTPEMLGPDSEWQSGREWMQKALNDMPLKTFSDLTLSEEEIAETEAESSRNIFLNHASEILIPGRPWLVDAEIDNSATFNAVQSVPLKGGEDCKEQYMVGSYCLDPVVHGWEKSNKLLGMMYRFCYNAYHKSHLSCRDPVLQRAMQMKCKLCRLNDELLLDPVDVNHGNEDVTDHVVHELQSMNCFCTMTVLFGCKQICKVCTRTMRKHQSEDEEKEEGSAGKVDFLAYKACKMYWARIASDEVRSSTSKKDLEKYTLDNGIFYYNGRIAQGESFTTKDLDVDYFFDSSEMNFMNPVVLSSSKIFYSFAMFIHWKVQLHGGVERLLRKIMDMFYPVNPRPVLQKIIRDCSKCRIIRRKTVELEMAKHHKARLTLAPAFYSIQIDLAENFKAYLKLGSRKPINVPGLVIVCLMSGATAAYIMEDWSTDSVSTVLLRHGCRYGFPKDIYVDPGTQLKKLKDFKISFRNLQDNLLLDMGCNINVGAPKAHSSRGRVEQRVKLVKELLKKCSKSGLANSMIGWETALARVCNVINNVPICRGENITRNEWNIITPNRLILGKNNERSTEGPFKLDGVKSRLLEKIKTIESCWYQLFISKVHTLIPRPKWHKSSRMPEVGDVCLFVMDDSQLKTENVWHYGRVIEVYPHGKKERVSLEYTVGESWHKKKLERNVRDVSIIFSETELIYNSAAHQENATQ